MTTKTTSEVAHEALHPLWSACNEYLMQQMRTQDANSIKIPETPGGAEIRRYGGVIMVSAEFMLVTNAGDEAEEEVTVIFPEDISDLSKTLIERVLLVNSGDKGTSGGNVGLSDFPKYASLMLNVVTPDWIHEPA